MVDKERNLESIGSVSLSGDDYSLERRPGWGKGFVYGLHVKRFDAVGSGSVMSKKR